MTTYRWLLIAALIVVVSAALAFTRLGDPLRTKASVSPADVKGPPGEREVSNAEPNTLTSDPPRGDIMIDPRRRQLVGVRTEAVTRGPIAQNIRAVAIVRVDETRQAEINTKVDGWIRELNADYVGKSIRAGERLFTLYSPALLTTENEYLLARRGHMQSDHAELDVVRNYSERLHEAARERLLRWDLTTDDIRDLEERGQATGIITVRSPVGGVVVEKAVVTGMRVTAGQQLFRIADMSVVWVEADVYERDMAAIRVGQPATVTLDAYPGETFSGRTTYVYPTVEEATRTAKARIQLPNQRGRLKPGMYATVDIQGDSDTGLSIPVNALLDSGTEQVVFVAEGDGYFTPRRVKAGRRFSDRVEIIDGLEEGVLVATSATFFLDSESQLRAGLQSYEPSPGAPGASASPSSVDISFRSLADPPRTGENEFEVTVEDTKGQPVTDADVSVRFFMPAMPTMNMPAMQNESSLPHSGNGSYRGMAQVLMRGRWDVTVTVRRGSQQLGQRQFAIVAK